MTRAGRAVVGAVALAGALAGIGVSAGPASAQIPPEPLAWILADGDTGAVFDARNPRQPVSVASAVKLMTALTAVQRISAETEVATSAGAAAAPSPSLGVDEGESWQQQDLMQAMLLSSANDAAYALAEGTSGSLDQFAADMTALGVYIGLEDSTFADPSGLDDESSFNGGSLMSAYDLAVVARNVLGVPELAATVALPDYRVVAPGGVQSPLRENINDFLGEYDGATGMKTGFTQRAGNVLVASATREGRRMIAVVLNAGDAGGFAAALLDRGFATSPDERGDGRLPPPRLTSLDGRRLAILDLPRALGRPALAVGATDTGAPVAPPPPTAAAGRSRASGAGEANGGGFPLLTVTGVVAVVVFAGLLAFRHRVERRRRRHFLARRRTLAEARRRGNLDILDADAAADPSHVRVLRD